MANNGKIKELAGFIWSIADLLRGDYKQADYGNNFNEKNLRRMIQFAEVFPDKEIVVTLLRQLSWSHFIALIPLKNDLQRDFYAKMCRVERWSVRTLRKKIDGMLYERTAISKISGQLILTGRRASPLSTTGRIIAQERTAA